MSSDTSASSPNAQPSPDVQPPESGAPDTGRGGAPMPEIPKQHPPGTAVPGRHEQPRDRSGRAWAWITAGAAVAFCVALVFGAMRLTVDVGEVEDTPERTVDAFLEALLDRRDAEAAAGWLCAEKADRDLSEAVAALSGTGGFDWGEVTETGRSVGAATVTAEITSDKASSAPTTWEFSLVAEAGEPQWLICGIAAG